ncbi:hypothetical protein C5167_051203 [Papaver somniferum]|uniref:Uncharacterized protein n=1 Tax=Papaver somniferum TaxID=3469 RepID=A0A4Y7KUC4_PAPSO|nr:hypothetical protein C5167_051203 [Papaver somniferum]
MSKLRFKLQAHRVCEFTRENVLAHWVLALSLFYLQEHMETTGTRFVNQRQNMTAEQMAIHDQ